MTNLSKQIFEVCGAEPRFFYKDCPVQDLPEKEKNKECKDCNAKDRCHNGEHPDLETNANNFVKMQNIVYKCGVNSEYDFQLASMSYTEDNYSDCFDEENTDTFEKKWLQCLLFTLNPCNPDSWDRKYVEAVTQAIREAEWEW